MRSISAVLHIDDTRLAEAIEESIEVNSTFTNVVQAEPGRIASKGLAIVFLNTGTAEPFKAYLSILKKQGRVATGQVRVKGIKNLDIGALVTGFLIAKLPDKFQKKTGHYFNNDYQQFSPKLAEHIFDALKALKPGLAAEIDSLYDFMERPVQLRISSREQDAAVEKDALGLTLDIFGVDRSAVFRSWKAGDLLA
jgi:hypothetical protein